MLLMASSRIQPQAALSTTPPFSPENDEGYRILQSTLIFPGFQIAASLYIPCPAMAAVHEHSCPFPLSPDPGSFPMMIVQHSFHDKDQKEEKARLARNSRSGLRYPHLFPDHGRPSLSPCTNGKVSIGTIRFRSFEVVVDLGRWSKFDQWMGARVCQN